MDTSSRLGPPINADWLNEIPEHIIEQFKGDEPPIFFLGSGFSKEAVPPLCTGGELVEELQEELGIEDENATLAELFQFQLNKYAGSKPKITEWLMEKLKHGSSKPGGTHRLLLELPSKIFLTTNFDMLLTDAALDMNYGLIPIDDPANFWQVYNNNVRDRDRKGILGRLHGSFDSPNNIVATTNDYIDWYIKSAKGQQWQSIFEDALRDRMIIFIGYSLRDFTTWTSFIKMFGQYSGRMDPHALVSPQRSKHYAPFWQEYNISYISLTASQFLITIHDRLGNINEDEDICLASAAACTGKTYEETKEIAIELTQDGYRTMTLAATRILMDNCL